MRLFIAINLNGETKDYLTAAIQELKRRRSKGFYAQGKFHLTLVFSRELDSDKLGAIKSAMNRVKGEPFGLSFIPDSVNSNGTAAISTGRSRPVRGSFLRSKQLTEELEKEGFKLEDRTYSPHLTLGREVRLADSVEGYLRGACSRKAGDDRIEDQPHDIGNG
jgi:2'-5' RNA ligase